MIRRRERQGRFIKHCPCTPGAVACGYFNLNLHTGCPFACSYCILQTYLESKQPVFFSNFCDLEKELEKIAGREKHLRLGTGELSDSLAFENQAPTAGRLVSLFERFPQAIFEFKTKSDRVENLLRLVGDKRAPANIVVSWSLNPQTVINREEHGSASLQQRLNAMAQVLERGYRVGIHFDPLILFPGWQTHYRGLLTQLRRTVRPERIAWWSLGALRFPPALKERIFQFRQSRLFWGELVIGFDGKYRYFRPLRLELMRFIIQEIKKAFSAEIPLYLCMEEEEAWRELLPGRAADEANVNRYLYQAAFRR